MDPYLVKDLVYVVNEPAFNGVEFGVVTSTQVISKITLKGTPSIKHPVHTIILLLQ